MSKPGPDLILRHIIQPILFLTVSSALRTNCAKLTTTAVLQNAVSRPTILSRDFSSLLTRSPSLVQRCRALQLPVSPTNNPQLLATPCTSPSNIRTLMKFSRQKGKRKSVKAVLKRFMRLDWGAWIRTKSGRHKKLWKKSSPQKRRLRQHVLTNSTQSWLLDSMVTSFWRRPKHYVNDPYRPYHSREEYLATRRTR